MGTDVRARLLALLVAALGSIGLIVGTSAGAAGATSIAGVSTALKSSPVYVDPAADAFKVDAQQVAAVTPKGTYLAVLPTSAVSGGLQPDELPALVSGQLGRGGTVIVLLGKDLYGASTTLPGRLGGELATAQAAFPAAGGDASGALVSLMRSLSGSGDLQDGQGPARAGGPISGAVLIVFLIIAAIGALALWWRLRRKPGGPGKPGGPRNSRRNRPKAPPRPRDLVEIDADGVIIRRTPAAEREQHFG